MNIADIIRLTTELRMDGPCLRGACPSCGNSSLQVDELREYFHCQCGFSGNAIDWVMKVRAITFQESIAVLRQINYGSNR